MDKKNRINNAIRLIAQLSIDKSSQVFSKLIKGGAKIDMENAYVADITTVTQRINQENSEVVGTFVDLLGDAPFKFLFFVNVAESLLLADMMLRRELGTSKELDVYTLSAVQEIGNILASAISNVFSTDFQITMKPTPPVVVHDYAGTIFEEYIMNVAAEKDDILIIESKFVVLKASAQCHMFVLPVADSEKVLSYIANTI